LLQSLLFCSHCCCLPSCNRKDTARLEKVESLIAESVKAAELSSSEEKWLTSILESAGSGSWESAASAARTDDGRVDALTRRSGFDVPMLVCIFPENLFLENRKTYLERISFFVRPIVYSRNWSDSERTTKTLMSKTHLTIRTAFTGFIAALLLFVQPATLVMHVGCEHSRSDGSHTKTTSTGTSLVASVWHWCAHAGCTHHPTNAVADARSSSDRSTPTPAPSAPHGSDECQICQTIFAARISLPLVQCPVSTGIAVALPDRFVPEVGADRQYRLRSRGPPL